LRGLRHFWSDGVGLIDRFEKIPAFFYQNELGNQPVRYSILGLSSEDRRLIGRDIQKVEFGWPLGMPCCRNLGDGRWEVRSDLSGGKIGRVLFCVAQNRIVLLHGFVKKTRKTPSRDLQVALRRMKEVL
jgi:phage-related protein